MGLLYTFVIGLVLKSIDSCDCEALREENDRLKMELRASRELDGFMRRARAAGRAS